MSHNQKNRRTFLKTAAVAPVTIPLSRSILLSQGNSSEESLAIQQHPARELEIGVRGQRADCSRGGCVPRHPSTTADSHRQSDTSTRVLKDRHSRS